jgi:predicted house-cleaning noncanonical NTP pyrophosphatase (MazG superfamily)
VTIDWIFNRINGFDGERRMNTDQLYKLMIDHVGGLCKIDWLSLYKKMNMHTNNDAIIEYIAKEIINDGIYKHFVDRYNLRVDRITDGGITDGSKYVVLKWGDDREKLVLLSELVYNKRDWWKYITLGNVRRQRIVDYDMLLSGRSEDEVLPDRCPIDTNIVMNYTRIDFSENNNKNINICKKINDDNIEWSFASIDRIDSTKSYSYDNIEVISNYYNTQVKNCASHSQIGKLYYYQLKKLLSKKISKELVKSMSDDELYKVSDMFSVYFKLFEIVNDNNTILHKEMVRRDKKSKLVVKI